MKLATGPSVASQKFVSTERCHWRMTGKDAEATL